MVTFLTILNWVVQALYWLILIRVALSWFPSISPYNPFVYWLRRIIDPILAPFRRILPTFGGIDFSPILAILVLLGAQQLIQQFLVYNQLPVGLVIGTVIKNLLLAIITIFAILILLRLLVSLLHASPFHPLVMGLRQLTDPLTRPFANLLPTRQRYNRTAFDLPAVMALGFYIVIYVATVFIFRVLGIF